MANAIWRSNQLTNIRAPWWLAGISAATAAAVTNAIVYGLARAAETIPQDVLVDSPTGEEPIGLAPVIFASIVPILIAAVLYVILRRFTAQPIRNLWIVAVAVLVLSFVQPFTISEAPAKMVVTLLIMHIVAVFVGIGTFTRLVRR